MPCRAGITTRLEQRKQEWKQQFPAMRNWQTFGPFASQADAQAWEDRQACERSRGGSEPDDPRATWWGYRFDF